MVLAAAVLRHQPTPVRLKAGSAEVESIEKRRIAGDSLARGLTSFTSYASAAHCKLLQSDLGSSFCTAA
jgi:hypothetical protein